MLGLVKLQLHSIQGHLLQVCQPGVLESQGAPGVKPFGPLIAEQPQMVLVAGREGQKTAPSHTNNYILSNTSQPYPAHNTPTPPPQPPRQPPLRYHTPTASPPNSTSNIPRDGHCSVHIIWLQPWKVPSATPPALSMIRSHQQLIKRHPAHHLPADPTPWRTNTNLTQPRHLPPNARLTCVTPPTATSGIKHPTIYILFIYNIIYNYHINQIINHIIIHIIIESNHTWIRIIQTISSPTSVQIVSTTIIYQPPCLARTIWWKPFGQHCVSEGLALGTKYLQPFVLSLNHLDLPRKSDLTCSLTGLGWVHYMSCLLDHAFQNLFDLRYDSMTMSHVYVMSCHHVNSLCKSHISWKLGSNPKSVAVEKRHSPVIQKSLVCHTADLLNFDTENICWPLPDLWHCCWRWLPIWWRLYDYTDLRTNVPNNVVLSGDRRVTRDPCDSLGS